MELPFAHISKNAMRLLTLTFLIFSSWVAIDANDKSFAKLKSKGDSALYKQHYSEALKLYSEAADVARVSNETPNWLKMMASIGQVYSMMGNHERALVYFKRILPDANKVKDPDFEPKLLTGIITCQCNIGDTEGAKINKRHLDKYKWKDHKQGIYYDFYLNGLIDYSRGDKIGAAKWFKKSRMFAQTSDMTEAYETASTLALGMTYYADNITDTAAHYFGLATESAAKAKTRDWLAQAYDGLNNLKLRDTIAKKYEMQYDSVVRDINQDSKEIENAQNILYKIEDREHKSRVTSLADTISKQQWILVVFIILILSLFVVIYIIIKQKRRQLIAYRLLIEKNNELSKRDSEIARANKEVSELLSRVKPRQQNQKIAESDNAGTTKATIIKRIEEVMDNPKIINSPDFNINILCREVASNRTYVSSAINETYGKSFPTLLNERRVRQACVMLEQSEMCVADIAAQLGYSTPSHFISVFKSVMAMTPGTYRRLRSER